MEKQGLVIPVWELLSQPVRKGPFTKHPQPILENSQEVLIWNQDGGIASLASINRSLYFAQDGLNFSLDREQLLKIPTAPGLYRPHLTDHAVDGVPGWGISRREEWRCLSVEV